MPNERQLQDLRARIDELDGQLLHMITTRAELAKAVAAAKGGEPPIITGLSARPRC